MFYEFHHIASPGFLKVKRDKNFSFPPHLHQCFELIVLLSGKMHITVNDRLFDLSEGNAILVFPNQIHSLQSSESEHILCVFSPDLVQEYTTRLAGKIPQDNLFVPDSYLVNALFSLNENSTTTYKKGVLYSFCSQFDNNKCYEPQQKDSDGLLNKIFAFVEDSFSSDCSLKKLAQRTGYDYAYLSRIFRKIVGISYNDYVNQYRLSHVCYLLENTNLPIIRCALESGYESVRSFNRNFKAYLDMTPTNYRERKLETHSASKANSR